MKLMYRGIPYEASFTSELAADSPAAPHRDAPSKQRSTKEQLRRPGNELTYRGVRYKP